MDEKKLAALRADITDKDELFWKGVLYGEFGMRKTTTALRCGRKRTVLLHADRGWSVMHNHPDEFDLDKVIPIEYRGLSQIDAIREAILEGAEPFQDVDLLILDTVSQMQEIYIDFLLENADYGGKFRDSMVPKAGVKNFEKTEIPGMPDYQLARNKMRPIVDRLVKAPINVMFLAHVREPGPMERANGKIERRPNITEALYKVISRDATFIGYMSKDKGDYNIDFTPKPTQSVKSQIPELTDKKIKASELPEYLNKWSTR
jgi:hypothetical protein